MTETRKTLVFIGAAAVLALIAIVVSPRRITPELFRDQGEMFFPDFKDPNLAKTLEVIEFDEATGEPKPFKVTFEDNKWVIPSHHDYPADARDHLAKTAAGVIDIRKEEFRTENVADHEACGVVDPLDDAALSLQGRGTRITLKDASGEVLADFIVGKKVEGHEDLRFVRIPGQKRVYTARMDIDLSTKFQDWIDPDLLQTSKDSIDRIAIKDYSINERTKAVERHDEILLQLKGDSWTADKMPSGDEVDMPKMNQLLGTLGELKIVDVRPKPEGLTKSLTASEGDEGSEISTDDRLSLQNKGFFFNRDGELLSNEGELQFRDLDGVIYTLRFGEVVYGSGTAGADGGREARPSENRYLFVTTNFDPKIYTEPPKPPNTDFLQKDDSLWTEQDKKNKEMYDRHNEWKGKIVTGDYRSRALNGRFAKWYYVISSDSFDKLHLNRNQLIVPKKQAKQG